MENRISSQVLFHDKSVAFEKKVKRIKEESLLQ